MSNTITPTVFYRTLNVDGLEIFYREAGPRDAPTVLLLHGFPSSSNMFRNLIPMLGGTLRRLGPGQVFYESPEDVHTVSRNASKTKPAKFVVFLSKMKEHRFSLPFTSFGALNFSVETILHKAIFLTWRHV